MQTLEFAGEGRKNIVGELENDIPETVHIHVHVVCMSSLKSHQEHSKQLTIGYHS